MNPKLAIGKGSLKKFGRTGRFHLISLGWTVLNTEMIPVPFEHFSGRFKSLLQLASSLLDPLRANSCAEENTTSVPSPYHRPHKQGNIDNGVSSVILN